MKLYNPARTDYPMAMHRVRQSLLSRLRAWSQRTQWMLCLCLLSFAFASFCNAQDLADPVRDAPSSHAAVADSDSGADDDAADTKRCADCHNHHGAALPLLLAFNSLVPPSAEPMATMPTLRSATTTRELRPPIA